MTRLDKILLAIEKGITCNPITGKVYGVTGKELKKNNLGYICFSITKNKKQYYLKAHQFIWYCVNKEIVEQIDHINGVRDDNRIENLRSVTQQQNNFNRKDIKGYFKTGKKWKSQIMLNRSLIYLGRFKTEEEARQAYLDAKEIYHII